MAISQNGYIANDPSLVSSRLIPGTTRKVTVRKGAAGDLLLWVAGQFDRRVEDIEAGQLDDWGYAERPVRGSTTDLSNHASGTAIDLNATKHPLGTNPTANFSAAQIKTIHAILAEAQGAVRWGGDYTGRKDGMHFEIVASEATCARVLAALNSGTAAQTEEEDMTPDQSAKLDAIYNQFTGSFKTGEYPGWPQLDDKTVVDFLGSLPEKVWAQLLKTPGWPDPNRSAAAGVIVGNADAHTNAILDAIKELGDRLAALEAKDV